MSARFIFFVIALLIVPASKADSVHEAPPKPYILSSQYAPYYLTMLPNPGDGYGIAYKLLDNGKSVELWRIDSYFVGAYLSTDGQHLARVVSAIRPDHGPFNEVAIEFFRSGQFFRSYLISDLVKNTSKINHSASHYIWMPYDRNNPRLLRNNILHLKTIDGIRYLFDMASGEIVESNSP